MYLVALILAARAIQATSAVSPSQPLVLSRSGPVHLRAMALSSSRDDIVTPSGSSVRQIETAAELDQIVRQTKNRLIAVFFGAKWSKPCEGIAPVFDELALATAEEGTVFCKVNVDKTREIADRYKVQYIPNFIFIRNGVVLERFASISNAELMLAVGKLLY